MRSFCSLVISVTPQALRDIDRLFLFGKRVRITMQNRRQSLDPSNTEPSSDEDIPSNG